MLGAADRDVKLAGNSNWERDGRVRWLGLLLVLPGGDLSLSISSSLRTGKAHDRASPLTVHGSAHSLLAPASHAVSRRCVRKLYGRAGRSHRLLLSCAFKVSTNASSMVPRVSIEASS